MPIIFVIFEKLSKALFVKNREDYPPLIHDLRRILEKAGVEIDDNKKIILDTVTRFNIKARYDDYKQNFYKLCTDSFTKEWIDKIKDTRLWIKSML
ncbi:MAG: HEPN domain-containing protein [Bacteroidales bacterium]|nr:HEPN domain-containing protein [Bacteroidales bacterium]MCF8334068.1 HEPN domain-containing protein [Bacteroidales bacterium]